MSKKGSDISKDVKTLLEKKKLMDTSGKSINFVSDQELKFVQEYLKEFLDKGTREKVLKERKKLLNDQKKLDSEISGMTKEIEELEKELKDHYYMINFYERTTIRQNQWEIKELESEIEILNEKLESFKIISPDSKEGRDIEEEIKKHTEKIILLEKGIKEVQEDQQKRTKEIQELEAKKSAPSKKIEELKEKKVNMEKRIEEIDGYFKISRKAEFTFKTSKGVEKKMKLSRSIIIDNQGHPYALGPGKGTNSTLLGAGAYGRVKIAQRLPLSDKDPHGFEFMAVKIQAVDPSDANYIAKEQKFEVSMPDTAMGKRKLASKDKAYTFMKLGGPSLWSVDKTKFNLADRVKLALSIAKDLKGRFHDKGYINRDIKGGNILVNTETGEGYIIDMGMVINLKKAGELAEKRLGKALTNNKQGTKIEGLLPLDSKSNVKQIDKQLFYQSYRFSGRDIDYRYWSPESQSGSQGNWFSKSSDIFSLSQVFFSQYDLGILGSSELSKLPKYLKDSFEKLKEAMGNDDPFKRPSVDDVISRLAKIQKELEIHQVASLRAGKSPGVTTARDAFQAKIDAENRAVKKQGPKGPSLSP